MSFGVFEDAERIRVHSCTYAHSVLSNRYNMLIPCQLRFYHMSVDSKIELHPAGDLTSRQHLLMDDGGWDDRKSGRISSKSVSDETVRAKRADGAVAGARSRSGETFGPRISHVPASQLS